MGDSMFREQYLDAVAAVINAQEAAGLDIVTDGDSRFDLNVGGKSWFFYPIERLGGIKSTEECRKIIKSSVRKRDNFLTSAVPKMGKACIGVFPANVGD